MYKIKNVRSEQIMNIKEWNVFSKVFWVIWFSSFTIEFAVMFSKMSHGVLGVLKTDLAISKICLNELNQTSSVCDSLKDYKEVQTSVQKRVNMLEMYGDMMSQVSVFIENLSSYFQNQPLFSSNGVQKKMFQK